MPDRPEPPRGVRPARFARWIAYAVVLATALWLAAHLR
ncbi:hypothetical protein MTDSW087_00780 [Methylobacterium dankookense]|uniref:Uncharacterized protein n=1 Tax=Methylobacterium dankookense TaxID=560405 RepID=A0A564FSW2_9HYPH|nr:hypothetical protein IFDJLNFL_0768 [Methylobacterium dankookense]VUF11107.1 hypothetical protein MTDSW087_00780 [Methylobacterium dankookense]